MLYSNGDKTKNDMIGNYGFGHDVFDGGVVRGEKRAVVCVDFSTFDACDSCFGGIFVLGGETASWNVRLFFYLSIIGNLPHHEKYVLYRAPR